MFGTELGRLLRHTKEQIDLVARVTQHPDRPKPLRAYDQIYMLPGSQLTQAKLISNYLFDRDVILVGDGDCMSLVLGFLGLRNVVKPPAHMLVVDFDERILKFISDTARQFHLPADLIDTQRYNVRYPSLSEYANRSDVFYTNPPYGSASRGESGKLFIARCMEFCKQVGSQGVALLPFARHAPWTRDAMANIQSFLVENGYVVSEMLAGVHQYHLDDRPELLSGTVVFDRVNEIDPSYAQRTFDQEELKFFYGSEAQVMPDYIDLDGNSVYAEGEEPAT